MVNRFPHSFQLPVWKAFFGLVLLGVALTQHGWANEELDNLEKRLTTEWELPVVQLTPSPMNGVFEAILADGAIVYVSRGAEFVFSGSLYERVDGELVDRTEERRQQIRLQILSDTDQLQAIAFPPLIEETRAVVHVFTDVDCGYCRQLHSELIDYHAKGIEIRYLAYPRGGPGSVVYSRMESAWCADVPTRAMTELKAGRDIETRTCENPVRQHYKMGALFGVTGTPAIVLPDGRMVRGYVPAEELDSRI